MRPSEYYFKEGCFIEEWHNTKSDEALSVARVRVELGATTKLHALEATLERYVILEGAGRAVVGNEIRPVTEGDVIVIPCGLAQQITNTGNTDLIFLAICSPRFDERNYREL